MNSRDGDLVRLCSEPVDHWAGKLDPGDWHAAFGERDSDSAGADRELKRRAVIRKLVFLQPLRPLALTTVGVVVMIGGLVDMLGGTSRLPTPHRQVNEEWLVSMRRWVYAVSFGYQLGSLTTMIQGTATYPMILCMLLVSDIRGAVLIGGVYGFGRGVSLVFGHRVHKSSALMTLLTWLASREANARRAIGGSQSIVGLLAVAAALSIS